MGTRLGQNFLRDKKILARIAHETLGYASPVIVEIGPGHGELTDALIAEGAKKIIAIEKDPVLAATLRKKYAEEKRVVIIEGDVREALPRLIKDDGSIAFNYSVAGNIPYYLTGFLLRILSELPEAPKGIMLTIQREVAERICAKAPHMNMLSAIIQGWATPEMVLTIPRGAFSPPPKVTSALLKITPHARISRTQLDTYLRMVKRLFAHPRKTAVNNIRSGTKISLVEAAAIVKKLGFPPSARPAEFDVAHISALAQYCIIKK